MPISFPFPPLPPRSRLRVGSPPPWFAGALQKGPGEEKHARLLAELDGAGGRNSMTIGANHDDCASAATGLFETSRIADAKLKAHSTSYRPDEFGRSDVVAMRKVANRFTTWTSLVVSLAVDILTLLAIIATAVLP